MEDQIRDIKSIIDEGAAPAEEVSVSAPLEQLRMTNIEAVVPGTPVRVGPLSLEIDRGELGGPLRRDGQGQDHPAEQPLLSGVPKAGTLIWNGTDELRHLPIPEAIYVTQKAYLLTGTLRENFEGYADEEIDRVLETVDLASWRASLPEGLGSWLGENGETLSGGQRKKLLLAQALLKKPQLLVVDEPTAGISMENAIAIFQNIQAQHPDIAILMATHLKEFEQVADKVAKI